MKRDESLVTGAAAAIVVGCALLPLLWLGAEALAAGEARSLLGAGTWLVFARTILAAAGVTALALAVGVPLGLLLARTDLPGRRVLLVLHAFPVFLPPFLLGLGWFHLLGRQGVAGSATTSRLLFGEPGRLLVLGGAFTPLVTALTVFGLDGLDPSLEEAARVVARPLRVATRILLPLAWPGAALGGLLVFALAFSELGVPMFLRVPAYPALVFARLGGIAAAPGEAFVLVVPMLALALVLLGVEALIRRGGRVTLGLRRDRALLPLGPGRGPLAAAVLVLVIVGLLPLVGLALAAAAGGLGRVGAWLGGSVANSLVDGAAAATVITAAGLVLGRGLARGVPAARFVDVVAVLAFVTPAAALGVGLIAVWNRPATAFLYASRGIVILGFVARYAVLGIRPLAAATARASPHLEDAARVAGAGYLRRLAGVVAPVHRRALLATWLFAAVFALRDLETAVLYYPPGGEPLTVRIFTLEANGPPAVVAALALVQVALTAALTGGALLALGRRR